MTREQELPEVRFRLSSRINRMERTNPWQKHCDHYFHDISCFPIDAHQLPRGDTGASDPSNSPNGPLLDPARYTPITTGTGTAACQTFSGAQRISLPPLQHLSTPPEPRLVSSIRLPPLKYKESSLLHPPFPSSLFFPFFINSTLEPQLPCSYPPFLLISQGDPPPLG